MFTRKTIFAITIVLLASISGMSVVRAYYVNEAKSGQSKKNFVEIYPWSEKGIESPKYVPNEILIKFNEAAAYIIADELSRGKTVKEFNLTASLDALNRKHNVKGFKAVFKNFKKTRKRLGNLKKKDKASLTKKEKHLLRRLKRAPADAVVPDLDRIYKLTVEPGQGQSLQEVIAEYNNDPGVEYAELNYIYSIISTEPNDPNYSPEMWGLSNTGQNYPIPSGGTESGTSDCDIDANDAWDTYTGNSDVIVAVVDSGVDYGHKDLRYNMWIDPNGYYGFDAVDDDNEPMDLIGHGTHCSGTIAADGNNGIDVSGVCWNARIMAVRIGNYYIETEDAAAGIEYAADNGADVLSNSWGGTEESNSISDAIDYAHSQGAVIVAAAGNNNTYWKPFYPANYEHVISVAATDANDERAMWPSGGGSNYGDWVDIAAPGLNILSLHSSGTDMYNDANHFYPHGDPNATMYISDGTSMACPHVAGACALLLSLNPDLSSADVNDILMEAADELDDSTICKYGRLNVNEAILLTAVPSKGHVSLERDYYACEDYIEISLVDYDLAGSGTQDVNVTTDDGDLETVTMVERSAAVGVFTGRILATCDVNDPNDPNDGEIYISHDKVITVIYEDANDGTGSPASPNDTALADCNGPVISNIQVSSPADWNPTISFDTDEYSTSRVLWGLSCQDSNNILESSTPLTSHSVVLSGLSADTTYFYVIEATDMLGNITEDTNDGNCYTFTTIEDLGDINVPGDFNTIQEAIDNSWSGNTIWVAEGTHTVADESGIDFDGKAITVRSADPNDPNVVAATIIDCNGSPDNYRRGFIFQNGEDANSILSGLTIKNGFYEGDRSESHFGGAIYIYQSSPTITNCVICDNYAMVAGAIYIDQGSPTITNCTISDNEACSIGSCGGIYLFYSEGNITNCTISGNKAGFFCGGIYLVYSEGNIDNCTISDNNSAYTGGGIFSWDSEDVIISNCMIVNNTAHHNGGGMFSCNSFYNSSSTIVNCTFSKNTVYNAVNGGGGLGNVGNPNITITVTVTNCIFWDNDANGLNNEIYNSSTISPSISYCDIKDSGGSGSGWDPNLGTDCGGNIDSDPCFIDADANDFHLDVNSLCINAGDPNGSYIGQVDIDGDQRVIRDRVDIGADEAKRVYNINQELWYHDIQPAIDDAATNDVIVVLEDTYTGDDNRDLDFGGKAITVRGSDTDNWDVVAATVIDCNSGWSPAHRGFYFHSDEDADSVVSGLTITRGYGDLRYGYLPGRAIFCDDSSPTITNCLITDNSAIYGLRSDGGGIACYNGASPEISNCIISDNYAQYSGGISCWDSEPTIRNCLIAGNSAGLGGGIACYKGEGSLHPEIVNCTFSDNSASYGGGMHNEDSEPNVVNCIFWDDSAVSGNDEIYNYSADPNFSYCDIEGCGGSGSWNPSFGTDCGGNIDSDPFFVPDDYYYHIDVNSPCIDTGDPNVNIGQVDIDFEDRVDGNDVDMGSDEYDS